MTTYLTSASATYTPTVIDGYESARESSTVVHQILGRSNPDISIRPAALRTGTLRLVFGDVATTGGTLIVDYDGYVVMSDPYSIVAEADSLACEVAHAAGGVFSIVSSDRSTIVMSYVASGAIRRRLDDETRAVWLLDIDFHEVET